MTKPVPLGICVIGSGRAGMIHARSFATGRVPHAALVAIAEPVDDARSAASRELELDRTYTHYQDALADPRVDAVVVATPSELHCAIVVAAAQAGKHILCEKPMAMNAAECDQMLAAVERAGVKLQIGFMRRFDASFVAAQQRIAAGEIGRVVQVKSLTHGPTTPKPWMYDIRQSNGPLSEVNSHDIDTVRWFSGSEFTEVYALAGNYRSPGARQQYPDFYDNVVLSARLENGMQGVICGAQGVQYGYDARCEILGERGLITVGSLAATTVVAHTVGGSMASIVRSWTDLFLDAYRAEDEDFVRCIREDAVPRAGGRDGKAAVMVVNAGNRSIMARRPVKLSEEGAFEP
jgi:myo-inositol 2-dehydrogenase/D-chiro-inositol 1-dehydrogenase/scyllo-inositol 2-dehydrogenase (NAD+)